MVIQWSVKSPSSVCLLLISILVIYVIYFPFLVSWSLVLVPSVIGLRSLCTSAAAACLLLLLIDEPWCCRVDYAMLPCPDLGVLPTCTWSIRLALGCPTHHLAYGHLRSGTWLPNSMIWHVVAQHFDMVPDRHMGAQHVFRSTWLYIFFDLAGRASYWLWSTMWHLLFIRSGGYMWCTMDISFFVYMIWLNCIYLINVIHYIPCSWTLLLSAREFIGTHADPDFSMLHSMYTSSLRYLSAPHYLSWRYSIIC